MYLSEIIQYVQIGVTETVRATTTVTVNNKGPITATSIIESIPNSDNNMVGSEGAPSTVRNRI